jgi:hypothetical protein
MDEFTTYIFKENEIKTNNKRVIKERTFYIGLLIGLFGFALQLLEIEYSFYLILTGAIIVTIGRIAMSGKNPSIGHRPLELKIRKGSITIGQEKIDFENKSDIQINILGYRGQGINQRTAFYKMYSGNDNTITLRYKDKEAKFQFVLDSELHKDKLLKFCEKYGFNVRH